MSHPVDPSFGRHGNYTTGRSAVEAFRQGSFTTPTNMYHGNARQVPSTFWQKITTRADSIRDVMGDKCCRCLHHMPSLVLIIGILVLIGLAIAAVPVAFVLISNAGQTSEPLKGGGDPIEGGRGVHFQPIRIGLSTDWASYNEEIDSDEEEKVEMRAISASALFPPNVSLCTGFGFHCTSQPSLVVPTWARCDGKPHCPDGSDELSCRECQTPAWCELGAQAGSGKARERLCISADQLCDGIKQCPDGVDESSFCHKSNEKCPAKTHRCADSPLCLPEDSVCDGIFDCRRGDDEQDCKECSRGAKMCVPNGRCVPRSQLCDGEVNCDDGSDEMDCDCKGCSGSTVALCGNGRCLDRNRVCDGTIDCEGGLDEQDCPGTCRALNSTASSTLSLASGIKTIECADARHYPESEACSGLHLACLHACPKCDAKQAFACDDGACIRKMQVCDGQNDCAGGEDEKNCADACSARGNFKCASSAKCIPVDAKCDGARDCEDGSDEVNCTKCPSGSLHCVPDSRCFPALARCDGVNDCSDGSDEADCTCQECTGAHSDTYSCEATSHCFKRDAVCDPFSKCPKPTKTDKLFCAAKSLERSLF